MATITRNVLKGIVKQCLVEILTEGLVGPETPVESRTHHKPQAKKSSQAPAKRPQPANLMKVNAEPRITEHIQERIQQVSGDNDVMRDILADTASRTLPNMVAAERKEDAGMVHRMMRGDTATKAMATNDPMDIFEGASNWAALAFTDTKASTNS
jgi:hypothetical protein